MHPCLVDLEKEAIRQGTDIHDVFQGDQVGKFTILAPSRDRYIRLIPDLDKTPTPITPGGGILTGVFGSVLQKARNYLDENWDIDMRRSRIILTRLRPRTRRASCSTPSWSRAAESCSRPT
jgi:hypothetical protein